MINKKIKGYVLYYVGSCLPNYLKIKMYTKSAEYGNDKALFRLGILQNNEEYLSRSFNKGNKDAAYLLGQKYEKSGDYEMAEYFYISSILSNNDIRAMNNLAIIYFRQKNYKQMINLYLRAINEGNPYSMYNLGIYYESIEDYNNMIKYYTMAAQKNIPQAMVRLGAYYHDIGDIDNMLKYYKDASYIGNKEATMLLRMYYTDEKDTTQLIP